ncbi:15591_t:CDS:2 [Entrophospora sp. SA101]|nr:15589_t:CDS:2 [Entrophospora sp. SA101]CAJ0646427.1 15591_t:CDS:2 [Entrophospora sp. SA101]
MPNSRKSCLGCKRDRKRCKYDPNNDNDDNNQHENLINKDDFFKGDKSYIGYNNYAFEFDPSLPSDSDVPFSNNPIT